MIKICVSLGVFHPRIEREPRSRISQSQREAMLKAAQADPKATLRGFDSKMRPVIVFRNQHASRPTTYSLMRNGDATKPIMPLYEEWREEPNGGSTLGAD